ncbi:3-hydroxyacyl-[acyl-carrier-protein] dehydratase FabZ [Anaerocolumna cellulosilytica]|uniref:3-hydroxyacyl-[acyl-carrier-protein] dehydratase n=1 Tax=Anaerocolumna cellulosilytica TaxID=433286 RepID=A0A6S6R1X2_9FIRM|nr:3-hydroxyacyl-ACP dehydratase FabZ [Anaerocolumna cellulosilytica]MBB5197626.1 beta-hydroxyacyl-ACP dehydratase FabZ [Anaerocolumna cellulosilytica]BCJ93201.1 3-hydroxyacyl-[acyl-carrier-protein] dehydratase FabZ [Anaerocolumna cellulosilytica]
MEVNILEVMKHRYPFLLVDKVVEHAYYKSSKVIKNVTFNEPWVQGHYPGHPIMPGVLLIEAMGQASGFIIMDLDNKQAKARFGYLTKVDNAKFVRPVYPGDQLVIDSKLLEKVDSYVRIESTVRVEGRVAAKCKLTYILREEEDEL